MNLREKAMEIIARSKLAGDMRTCGQTVDVYVSEGDIILVGTVDMDEQRAVAVEIVRGMPGVRRIIDNIRVRTVRTSPT